MALYKIGNKMLIAEGRILGTEGSIVKLDKTIFNPASKVLRSLGTGERAIFIIRHSNRDFDKTSQDTPINTYGIANAQLVGTRLKVASISENDIYCGATDTRRTCETAYVITNSRGDTTYTAWTDINSVDTWESKPDNKDEALSYLNSSNFGTDGKPWPDILNTARATLQTVGASVTSSAISHTASKSKRLSLLVTHDAYVVPYIAYASGIKEGEGATAVYNIEIIPPNEMVVEWVNYMSGVAIIVNADGTLKELYPIKCLDSGTSKQQYY